MAKLTSPLRPRLLKRVGRDQKQLCGELFLSLLRRVPARTTVPVPQQGPELQSSSVVDVNHSKRT